MTTSQNKTSLRKAALTAGLTILIIAIAAPFAELYLYPKLVDSENPAQTVRNIISNKTLFVSLLFSYLFTFTGDIVIAGALYILLAPVHKFLSLLTALFRLVFASMALAALLNLVTVFRLLNTTDYSAITGQNQLNAQVMLCFITFRSSYHFGILFFGIHLVLLGYLVIRSAYINTWMGVILIVSGLGYFTDALKPFLFPDLNTGFLTVTFFGELIFMVWLLIKGSAIPDHYNTA